MITPQPLLVAARLACDAAASFLFGAGLFFVAVAPGQVGGVAAARLRSPMLAAALLAVAALLAWPIAEAASVGGGWSAVDPALLRVLLFATPIGRAWMIRAGLALLTAGATAVAARPAVATTLAGGLLASVALGGHAVMHDGWLGGLHMATDAVHVLAGAAWAGGLVPLVLCLGRCADRTLLAPARQMLLRFSVMGQVAVALVVATGLANTLLVFGGWPQRWPTAYQLLLALKILLVLGMIGLALRNRAVFRHRFGSDALATLRSIRRAACGELALAVGVLALVAVFGMLPPQ